MKKNVFLIIICLIANISLGQPSKLWMDKCSNASSYCIATDNLSYVYNAMEDNGTRLKAYDTEGEVLYSVNVNQISSPSDIVADSDNNWLYICGGPSYSLCKLDKNNGNVLWTEMLSSNSTSWGTTYTMALDAEGYVYIAGYESGLGYRVIKFDSDGNALLDNTFEVNGLAIPRAVTIDANDNIIVTGECLEGTALLKISGEGVLLWEVYDDLTSGGNGVIIDRSNKIVIVGSAVMNRTQFIHKFDADGNNIWKKEGNTWCMGLGIVEDAQGNYIVAGGVTTNLSTWEGLQTITCYSSSGDILWHHTEQEEHAHWSTAIRKMENGNVALSGCLDDGNYNKWAYTSVYEIIELQAYSVTFRVVDNINTGFIESAEINFNGEVKNTNSEGVAIFTNVLPGSYDFSISVSGYLIEEGNVTVLDEDIIKEVSMSLNHIADIQSKNLKVYPNPTRGMVNIEIREDEIIKVEYYITNVSGAVIKEGEMSSEKTSFSLSNFSSGCYYLVLKTNKGELTRKVVLVD